MSLEDIPNWIYIVFIAPLGFTLHKVINYGSKFSILETKVKVLDENLIKLDTVVLKNSQEKFDTICADITAIKQSVARIEGTLAEHLRLSSS